MKREKVLTVRIASEGLAFLTYVAENLKVPRSVLVRAMVSEALADTALMKRVSDRLEKSL